MSETGLSIIVPVYNESEGLRQTVKEMEAFLSGADMELILVNDGSDQKTADILAELGGGRVTVLHHEANRGYGAALKTGLRHARYDCVAITDADGTYPNARIPEFYQLWREKNLDMLVGARIGSDAYIPWVRRVPKWFIGRLANYVSGRAIPDLNSGLRLMRKEVVRQFLTILPDGFSFTSTITLAMLVNGFTVDYRRIEYRRRQGRSKIRPVRDTLNFIQLILRTTIYFDPLRVFVPLGLLLWLCAIAAIVAGVTLLERIPDVTIAIFALSGFQIICLGLVADLINRKFSSRP